MSCTLELIFPMHWISIVSQLVSLTSLLFICLISYDLLIYSTLIPCIVIFLVTISLYTYVNFSYLWLHWFCDFLMCCIISYYLTHNLVISSINFPCIVIVHLCFFPLNLYCNKTSFFNFFIPFCLISHDLYGLNSISIIYGLNNISMHHYSYQQ